MQGAYRTFGTAVVRGTDRIDCERSCSGQWRTSLAAPCLQWRRTTWTTSPSAPCTRHCSPPRPARPDDRSAISTERTRPVNEPMRNANRNTNGKENGTQTYFWPQTANIIERSCCYNDYNNAAEVVYRCVVLDWNVKKIHKICHICKKYVLCVCGTTNDLIHPPIVLL